MSEGFISTKTKSSTFSGTIVSIVVPGEITEPAYISSVLRIVPEIGLQIWLLNYYRACYTRNTQLINNLKKASRG